MRGDQTKKDAPLATHKQSEWDCCSGFNVVQGTLRGWSFLDNEAIVWFDFGKDNWIGSTQCCSLLLYWANNNNRNLCDGELFCSSINNFWMSRLIFLFVCLVSAESMSQVITARLSRNDAQPWGFRLQGGKDFGTPLVIQKVSTRRLRFHVLLMCFASKRCDSWKAGKWSAVGCKALLIINFMSRRVTFESWLCLLIAKKKRLFQLRRSHSSRTIIRSRRNYFKLLRFHSRGSENSKWENCLRHRRDYRAGYVRLSKPKIQKKRAQACSAWRRMERHSENTWKWKIFLYDGIIKTFEKREIRARRLQRQCFRADWTSNLRCGKVGWVESFALILSCAFKSRRHEILVRRKWWLMVI